MIDMMNDSGFLYKYTFTFQYVFCPRLMRIVYVKPDCVECPYYGGQDWEKVYCNYRKEGDQ
jgi:hypothetical protein